MKKWKNGLAVFLSVTLITGILQWPVFAVQRGQAGTISTSEPKSVAEDPNHVVETDTLDLQQPETIKVESITLTPAAMTLNTNETGSITAEVAPADAEDKSLTWTSSDANVATVDGNGKVTAVAGGTATITATANDGSEVTASCAVTVRQPVTGLMLDQSNLFLFAGKTTVLTATVTPENASDKTVTWTSGNPDVATVDANGKVTAVAKGTATITATANDGSGMTVSCAVTVEQAVTGLALDQSSMSLLAGKTAVLTAAVTPENADNKTVTWTSSDSDVATVDQSGKVTAVAKGTAAITATAADRGEVTATCAVTVKQPVTKLTLNQSSLSLFSGNTAVLTASAEPENADDKTVTWTSSDTGVATVDANGKVTAAAKGTATITATAKDGSGVKDSCTVTVKQAVTGLTLSESSLDLFTGKTAVLTASAEPESADDKTVTWTTSDTGVATVDENGKVTAVAKGTATITATANDGSGAAASCSVTVTEPVPVTSLTLSESSLTLITGKTAVLTASAEPESADDKTVTWRTSDTGVATVNESGKVTAVAKGTATITATANDGSGVKASCSVTVKQPVTSLKISKTALTLDNGKSAALTVTVGPSDANNKTLKWTSSNTAVATVSSTGTVKGVGKGTATIIAAATDGSGKKVTCSVTVKQPVTSLKISKTALTLDKGKSGALTVTVGPSNANNKTLKWTSSNTAVATVTSTGTVKGVSKGTATITAAATDGSGKKVTCSVTVKQPVTGLKISRTSLALNRGKTWTLKVTVSPSNANNKTLKWTSSNTAVATVTSTGIVKGIKKGTATITAAATDGSGKKVTCRVTVKQPVTALKISRTSLTLNKGRTYTLKVTVSPSNANNKTLKWTTSNKAVATVTSTGIVKGIKKGTATITATAADGSGKKVTCRVTVK